MTAGEGVGDRAELVLDAQQARRAILHQHRNLRRREPPVQRHEDRPGANAGEVHGQEVETVPGQHGHALADRIAQHLLEQTRAPVDPPMEFPVGEPQAGGEVADGETVRLHPAPIGDRIDHSERVVGGHRLGHHHVRSSRRTRDTAFV